MKKRINFRILSYTLLLTLLVLCTEDDPIEFRLTTNCVPEKTGTVSPESGMFTEGSEIELKATANPEYIFKHWEGDAVGDENPLKITMTKNKAITAVFEKVNYSLTIEVIGQGTVNQEIVQAKSSIDYPSGTLVQLTAFPDEGWEFVRWEEMPIWYEEENPMVLEMTDQHNVTVIFEPMNKEKIFVPDDNFEQALIEMGLDDKLDDYVYVQRIMNVTVLNLENREIEDLTGIEGFGQLSELNLANNNLSSLDLSHKWFSSVNVTGNPQLTCVQFHQAQLWYIKYHPSSQGNDLLISDEGVSPSVDCSVTDEDLTFVPDDAFEQALINLGLDNFMDNYVRTIDIVNISEIDLSGNNISDVTGIEDFKGLWVIDLSSNNLSSLDITILWPFGILDVRVNPLKCIQVNEFYLQTGGGGLYFIFAEDEVEFSLDCGDQ